MFSFLYSEQTKMRRNARNWLEMAERIHHHRRDQLTELQLNRLSGATVQVQLRLKEKADTASLKQAVEALEGVLRELGGQVYPMSSIRENVEFFLVAAIVILGLRAYFVQPFKIPTNSMWPSYYGMTTEILPEHEQPGFFRKVARLAALGASNYEVKAPADGEVLMPVFSDLTPAFTEKSGRSLFIFPTTLREYTFSVGGQLTRLTVPADWARSSYGEVVQKAFFPSQPDVIGAIQQAATAHRSSLEQSTLEVQVGGRSGQARVYWIPVGKMVKRGEEVLSFDILTGDMLFVDRFSYNFFPPKVGSAFVFRTGNIPAMQRDEYYIKRLVGGPGDKLEIRRSPGPLKAGATGRPGEGLLYRNDQPIQGSAAFERNARKEGLYTGYIAASRLGFDQVVNVPEKSYFALGDNSPNSEDSRFWGFVPDKDVVGRPLFIYYPLTRRWGPAL